MDRKQTMGLVARSGKKKQLTNRLILSLTNSFAQNIKTRVNDCEISNIDAEYQEFLTLVNNEYEQFKDELFEGINSLFKITELKLLNISSPYSRNYDIAIKKLADHYNFFLSSNTNHFIPFTEKARAVSNLLNYLSKDFEEQVDPNLEKFHTLKDKRKFTQDYNAISEMFIK